MKHTFVTAVMLFLLIGAFYFYALGEGWIALQPQPTGIPTVSAVEEIASLVPQPSLTPIPGGPNAEAIADMRARLADPSCGVADPTVGKSDDSPEIVPLLMAALDECGTPQQVLPTDTSTPTTTPTITPTPTPRPWYLFGASPGQVGSLLEGVAQQTSGVDNGQYATGASIEFTGSGHAESGWGLGVSSADVEVVVKVNGGYPLFGLSLKLLPEKSDSTSVTYATPNAGRPEVQIPKMATWQLTLAPCVVGVTLMEAPVTDGKPALFVFEGVNHMQHRGVTDMGDLAELRAWNAATSPENINQVLAEVKIASRKGDGISTANGPVYQFWFDLLNTVNQFLNQQALTGEPISGWNAVNLEIVWVDNPTQTTHYCDGAQIAFDESATP